MIGQSGAPVRFRPAQLVQHILDGLPVPSQLNSRSAGGFFKSIPYSGRQGERAMDKKSVYQIIALAALEFAMFALVLWSMTVKF